MDLDTLGNEHDAVLPLRTAVARLHSAQRAVAWDDHQEAVELVQQASAACREWLANVGEGGGT